METASEATTNLSGHLTVGSLVIVMQCCSTCLSKDTSKIKEWAWSYNAEISMDRFMVTES
jgi:hypothetical protein